MSKEKRLRKPRQYSAELKEEAVQMLLDAVREVLRVTQDQMAPLPPTAAAAWGRNTLPA